MLFRSARQESAAPILMSPAIANSAIPIQAVEGAPSLSSLCMPSRAKAGRTTDNAAPHRDLEKSRVRGSNAGQHHTQPGTAGAEAYDAVFVSLAVFQRPMIADSWEALYPTRLNFPQPEIDPSDELRTSDHLTMTC